MSTILASREVRWFLKGPIASYPELKRWFESRPAIGATSAALPPAWKGRIGDQPDRYLVFPGSADMGVKWREGELQIKGRVDALGAHSFVNGHVGHVERWCKWSYARIPSSLHTPLLSSSEETAERVDVHKTRALRKLMIDGASGVISEVDASVRIMRGVNAELADVRALGESWCSLAFEAFPDDDMLSEPFMRAVSDFLSSFEGPPLTADASLSYPGWLSDRVCG